LVQGGTQVFDLDCKTKEGYAVSHITLKQMTSEAGQLMFDPEYKNAVTQMSWYMLQKTYETNLDFARKGMVLVEDMHGVSFSEMLGVMKNDDMAERMKVQDNLPMRFRAVYIVNAPLWIRCVMALVRPFMKKKLREKMHLVTAEELPELVGIENVPKGLGGTFDVDNLDKFQGYVEEMFEKM
jgi:hypothetical protein